MPHSFNISKLLLFSLIILFFGGCKKDIPPELHCDQSHADQVCREDAFRRGQFLGYVEYQYLTNNLVHQKKYYSVSHSYLEETFEYNDKSLMIYKKDVDKDGNTIEERMIDHTDFDSVSTITVIKNGFTSVFSAFEYDNLKRLAFRYDYENGSMHKSVYLYGDDGKLFSESVLDENNNILSFKIYKNYLNNITKIFSYDANEILTGIELIVTDKAGNTTEIRKYDSFNVLRTQETFLYINNKLIKHAWLTGNYETEFRLFHYP